MKKRINPDRMIQTIQEFIKQTKSQEPMPNHNSNGKV
jgi:hypothetical protein